MKHEGFYGFYLYILCSISNKVYVGCHTSEKPLSSMFIASSSKVTISSMQSRKDTMRGFSLVEILLVLGLIASLAIGAFLIYPKIQLSRQINEASEKYVILSSSITQFFGDRAKTGLTRAAAISGGIATEQDLTSPWGLISVGPSASQPGYYILFRTVPSDACKKLLSALEPQSQAIRINGGPTIKSSTVAYSTLTSPIICDAAATRELLFHPQM